MSAVVDVNTFSEGVRVRHIATGRTGEVDASAVARWTRREYPDMVPVQWDDDDAWLTHPSYLEVVEDEPAASVDESPVANLAAWIRGVVDELDPGTDHDDEHGPDDAGTAPNCPACWGDRIREVLEAAAAPDPAASAEVVVHPPSSQAGLAAVRYRLGGPVAEPAGPADHRG